MSVHFLLKLLQVWLLQILLYHGDCELSIRAGNRQFEFCLFLHEWAFNNCVQHQFVDEDKVSQQNCLNHLNHFAQVAHLVFERRVFIVDCHVSALEQHALLAIMHDFKSF